MKVFYQTVTDASALLASSNTMEELCLPLQTITNLHRCFDRTNLLLPTSARTFKEWRVALLETSETETEFESERANR